MSTVDPWVQWAKDGRAGRDPSRAIGAEVKHQGRAMALETLVAVALAAVVAWRVVWQMGHGARGVQLFASVFLTAWTGALAVTLVALRVGTYRLRDDSPRGHLALARRRILSQLRLITPMRIALAAMAAFLGFWLPWLTWFAPHIQRQPVSTGLMRIGAAAALLWFLFAVVARLRVVTRERLDAVDSLIERAGASSARKG